jgi:Zn-finger nucleic acid-binding protein
MECPRCVLEEGAAGPYRASGGRVGEHPALVAEGHPSGVTLERCPHCGGAFFDHGELQKVESWWREHDGARPDASTLVTRAYQVARETTEPIPCPACGDETITREWGIGTLVMADVCLGCRGVWLDSGELDALFGAA